MTAKKPKKRPATFRRAMRAGEDMTEEIPELTEAELRRFKPVALAKQIRWKLKLSQVAFAKKYKIPLGTLRDWEQHRSEPDEAAKSYLQVIGGDPEVSRFLRKKPDRESAHR